MLGARVGVGVVVSAHGAIGCTPLRVEAVAGGAEPARVDEAHGIVAHISILVPALRVGGIGRHPRRVGHQPAALGRAQLPEQSVLQIALIVVLIAGKLEQAHRAYASGAVEAVAEGEAGARLNPYAGHVAVLTHRPQPIAVVEVSGALRVSGNVHAPGIQFAPVPAVGGHLGHRPPARVEDVVVWRPAQRDLHPLALCIVQVRRGGSVHGELASFGVIRVAVRSVISHVAGGIIGNATPGDTVVGVEGVLWGRSRTGSRARAPAPTPTHSRIARPGRPETPAAGTLLGGRIGCQIPSVHHGSQSHVNPR